MKLNRCVALGDLSDGSPIERISSSRKAIRVKGYKRLAPELWAKIENEVAAHSNATGRVITMRIDGTDPFATAKPEARLIKLLIRAHRFNNTLVDGGSVPFAALAKREGVSPSYFTRLVRLYLAPDITQAILEGRQPRDLTADQPLAHSRLPLAWQEQRTLLGFV